MKRGQFQLGNRLIDVDVMCRVRLAGRTVRVWAATAHPEPTDGEALRRWSKELLQRVRDSYLAVARRDIADESFYVELAKQLIIDTPTISAVQITDDDECGPVFYVDWPQMATV